MSKELEKARELVKMLEEKEKAKRVMLSNLQPGETFKIGEWDFLVLNQEDNSTKVISKNLLIKDVEFDSDSRDYNKSNLKEKIEEEILPVIVREIGEDNIIEHTASLVSVDNQKEFDDVVCKVRPLTFDEARKYNDLLVNKDLPDWWWTITPWSTEERDWKYSIVVVSPRGNFNDYYYCYGYRGVRPFCILKSNIFVSKGE